MCNACPPTPHADEIDSFGEKLLQVLNSAGLAMMISLGHRTGLFDEMASMGPATSLEIANQSNLNERYVREWLGAMVAGKIIRFHPETRKYHLPPQHAALLTRSAGPNNFACTMQWVSVLGGVEDQITECFREGGGVPYSQYQRFHQVMADESENTVVSALLDHILPMCEGLLERLETGIDVLDVGCGSGRALNFLAKRFPRSRFKGYDLSHEAIGAAKSDAKRLNIANVRFEVRDVALLEHESEFDLVTAFDSVHDQANPGGLLSGVQRALKRDGLFLMQDIAASSHVDQNVDRPLAPFLYTISCMHCMTVSLAAGGAGLGAVWGKELACEMLSDAGFRDVVVHELDHDIMNYFYLSRP